MLFLIVEDLSEQVAAAIVADALSIFHRVLEQRNRVVFQFQVAFEDFED